MNIREFIQGCENESIKAIVIKNLDRGDKLKVYSNDDRNVRGQYVVGYGGYTVTRV